MRTVAALAAAFALLWPWAATTDAARKRARRPPPETSEYIGESYRAATLRDCKPRALAVVNIQPGVESAWQRYCYYGRHDGRR